MLLKTTMSWYPIKPKNVETKLNLIPYAKVFSMKISLILYLSEYNSRINICFKISFRLLNIKINESEQSKGGLKKVNIIDAFAQISWKSQAHSEQCHPSPINS